MNTDSMPFPHDHLYRHGLNDEVHARPSVSMRAPMRASYLLCYSSADTAEEEQNSIHALASVFNVAPPRPEDNHYLVNLGSLSLKWERHTEFIGYTFFADAIGTGESADNQMANLFDAPVIEQLPKEWLASLPGDVLQASHVALLSKPDGNPDHEQISHEMFNGNALIGAHIADGAGIAMTDFRIQADGFNRLLVLDRGMSPRQSGRNIQRLLEIDSYRMMALLALPMARELSPFLARCELELVEITRALAGPGDADELPLLNRLTRLQADIESRYSRSNYRFGAANAYYSLVQRRISDLREKRIQSLQTLREFTEQRLAPAIDTCRAVAVRQQSLTQGVERATQLLSTRVDMARREQNQAVLESMDRRAGLQLRLQEAVEVVSIVAVTYYLVGLVGFASEGVNVINLTHNTTLVKAISIPVVATLVIFVVRRIRRAVARSSEKS